MYTLERSGKFLEEVLNPIDLGVRATWLFLEKFIKLCTDFYYMSAFIRINIFRTDEEGVFYTYTVKINVEEEYTGLVSISRTFNEAVTRTGDIDG